MTDVKAGDARRRHSDRRCILVGITAQQGFFETPALSFAAELAARCRALLSLYVFAPRPESIVAGRSGAFW